MDFITQVKVPKMPLLICLPPKRLPGKKKSVIFIFERNPLMHCKYFLPRTDFFAACLLWLQWWHLQILFWLLTLMKLFSSGSITYWAHASTLPWCIIDLMINIFLGPMLSQVIGSSLQTLEAAFFWLCNISECEKSTYVVWKDWTHESVTVEMLSPLNLKKSRVKSGFAH